MLIGPHNSLSDLEHKSKGCTRPGDRLVGVHVDKLSLNGSMSLNVIVKTVVV